MPAAHSPYRQSCWHRPQWCGSVAVSTQLPPHSASPASQLDPPPPVPPAPPAPPIDDDVLAELVALDVLVTLAEALDVDVVEDVALVVWAPLPPAPPVPFGAAFPASSPMIWLQPTASATAAKGASLVVIFPAAAIVTTSP